MKRLRNSFIPTILAICALSIPASLCYATVEPELTTAIRHNNVQHVRTLLSEGINVNERDEGAEQTPLMWAARTGSLGMVQSLLNHGAAVNARDDFGNTALDFALSKGYTRIATLLASHGAKAGAGVKEARNSGVGRKRETRRELATSTLAR